MFSQLINATLDSCAESRSVRLLLALAECSDISNTKNRIFSEIDEKRIAIGALLKKRYRKLLARPDWSDEELKFIGPGLRQMIAEGQQIRMLTEKRLAFCRGLSTHHSSDLSVKSLRAKTRLPLPVVVLPDEPKIDEFGRRVWPDENGEYTLVDLRDVNLKVKK